MRCPQCGAAGYVARTIVERLREEAWTGVCAVASATGAIVGQAEVLPEPYRHVVTVAFIVSAVLCAWRLRSFKESAS